MAGWTAAQRQQLTAILHPHKHDPADFIPTAAAAWAAAGMDGAPRPLDQASFNAAIERLWGESSTQPLLDYVVAAQGLTAAIDLLHAAVEYPWGAYTHLRRHLYAADAEDFAAARDRLLAWPAPEPWMQVARALALSRDPAVPLALLDAPDIKKLHGDTLQQLLCALPDAGRALELLQQTEGVFLSFFSVFDLVEMHGAAAAPILEEVLRRWAGKSQYKRPIEAARKLTQALGATPAAPATAPAGPKPWSPQHPPTEKTYDLLQTTAVFSGKFPNYSEDIIEHRLHARGVRVVGAFGHPKHFIQGFFAGAGAKQKLIDDAQRRSLPVCGPDELDALIHTPLFRFRERALERIQQSAKYVQTQVTHWRLGDPASDADIAAAERRLGVTFCAPLRALYAQCDGFGFITAKGKTQPLPPQSEDGFGFPQHGAGARAWIPSLARLQPFDLEAPLTMGRKTVKTISFTALLFDYWDEFYPTLLIFDPQKPAPEVWIGDDHGALLSFGPFSVEGYLEAALSDGFYGRKIGDRRTLRP
jgi:hypothetical protein